jgi:hypothetical protein
MLRTKGLEVARYRTVIFRGRRWPILTKCLRLSTCSSSLARALVFLRLAKSILAEGSRVDFTPEENRRKS